MFNYQKLNENKQNNNITNKQNNNITNKKFKKSDILKRYNFSLPIKILFYLNIFDINKCCLRNAV